MSVFKTTASTTRPQTATGLTPNEVTGYQLTETANAAARVKLYAKALAKPGAIASGADGAAGNCTVGDHVMKITYVTAQGETEAGTASATITSAGSKKIDLTGIPVLTGPGAELVTGRNIYMNEAGGATWYKVDAGAATVPTLGDNTTTTYSVNVADATLVGYVAAPSANTSGILFADSWLAAHETKDVTFHERSAVGGGLFRAEFTTGAALALLYGR